MGHYKKLYKKIKNNPKDVQFDDLEKLMIKVGGFSSKPGKGDHYTFSHPDMKEILGVDTRGKRNPLRAVYVNNCIKAFEELNPEFCRED